MASAVHFDGGECRAGAARGPERRVTPFPDAVTCRNPACLRAVSLELDRLRRVDLRRAQAARGGKVRVVR
jgi:hypothetical protein